MPLRVYFGDDCALFESTRDIKISCTIKCQARGATATDRDVREKISSGRKYIDPVRIRDIKILPETTKARKPEEQTCQCGSLEIHHSHFEFGALQRLIASYFKIPAIT